MIEKDAVVKVLATVTHPESGRGLDGFIKDVAATAKTVTVVLKFSRPRDPFAASLRKQAAAALSGAFPGKEVEVSVATGETEPAPAPSRRLPGIKRVVAIASGKGGVGKSTLAAHLAVTLARSGYKVGVLDADIHGPSQPALFGVGDYIPAAESGDRMAAIVPAESMGVKIMSIGFFISPENALVWRGPMATGALRQLTRQTMWGELDYLLVDLPPGTGDVHLSLAGDIEIDGAVIVSTPQNLALADVRRGVDMFRSEGVGVPILGMVENMAWFTPAELPDNKYFIFGKGGVRNLAEQLGTEFLGEVPIVMSVMEGGENGLPATPIEPETERWYEAIARRIVERC